MGGASWHADVGFGGGTLLQPLPFGTGDVHEQSGWRFRVIAEGDELVLQTADDSDWADLYAFSPQPVPLVDLEVSNWFTSAHPNSPFVTGLLISAQTQDGTRTTLSDWGELALAVQTPAASTVTPLTREEIPQLLHTRFGLEGFALNDDGRVVRASDGRA
jgi:N-hydroxyarylamine O-acetyltransferase